MKHKKLIIFLVIMMLVGVCLVGVGVAMFIGNKDSNDEKSDYEKKIQAKADAILKEIPYSFNPLIKIGDLKVAELSNVDKNALVTIAGNNIKIEKGQFNEERISEKYELDNVVGYIKKETLFKKYEELYGRRLKEAPSTLSIGCPFGVYDQADERYYMSSSCGGTGFWGEFIKEYKIEEDEEHGYYYFKHLVIAREIDDDGEETDPDHLSVYKDYYNDKSKKAVIDADFEEVDDKYFENAAKYVLIFDKKDGEYYFSELKKIEH